MRYFVTSLLCVFTLSLTAQEAGCTYQQADNFSSTATVDDGTCVFGGGLCGIGTMWNSELELCEITNPTDSNFDGCTGLNDLLILLSMFGDCSADELFVGCMVSNACNYNPNALSDDGSCFFGGSVESSCDDGDPFTFNDEYQLDGCTCEGIQSVSSDGTGPCNSENTINYEGYEYRLVEIYDQCWYQENIRYLPEVNPTTEYSNSDPKFYVYNYNGTNVIEAQYSEYYEIYGALYNYPAIINSDLCPFGWHVSTGEEWLELAENFGGANGGSTGYYLKSNYGWVGSPGNGNNESGFEALPGGKCRGDSNSSNSSLEGAYGRWWATPPPVGSNDYPPYIGLSYNSNSFGDGFENDLFIGYSARCIKD